MPSSPSPLSSRGRSHSRDRGGEDDGRRTNEKSGRSSHSRRNGSNNDDHDRGDDDQERNDDRQLNRERMGRASSKRRDVDCNDGSDWSVDKRKKNGDRERWHRHKRCKSSRHHKSSRHRSRTDRQRSKRRRHRLSSSDFSSCSRSTVISIRSNSSLSSESSVRRRKRSKRSSSRRSKKRSKSSLSKGQQNHPTLRPCGNAQINQKLLSKLSKRNETLEEREERRAKRRAARITARFGYTADNNPFRDPNLHETFTWKKKEERVAQRRVASGADEEIEKGATEAGGTKSRKEMQEHTFAEIEKVRQRRQVRELHLEEMERIRAEESRMKELENYDEWARKEEEFHLQQQKQRSAIRLVEGREKPVDVLAQNMLLFGLSQEEKLNRGKVKYRERYSALEELETLETNLEEPHQLLQDLKLSELKELLVDIDVFRRLEREAVVVGVGVESDNGVAQWENTVIRYWDALHTVTLDEIHYLKMGGQGGATSLVVDIRNMFNGQTMEALMQTKADIENKLCGGASVVAGIVPRFDEDGVVDTDYWQTVLDQLNVHLSKMELSNIHSKMLVRQLEKLEAKREELHKTALSGDVESAKDDFDGERKKKIASQDEDDVALSAAPLPQGVEPDFGNLEEELGLNDEIDLSVAGTDKSKLTYAWQDRYRPRKPRYFNRVKTGYDWNAYNKTHYDHDNPPPKIVQGYKFNIFYPDLIDRTATPQYFLERADTDNFCILRFSAGPPYEDVAFKIINRQWNKSRKRGFRCTFERGVLSLYFNFASHWYRR